MFQNGNPDINYIGRYTVQIVSAGIAKTEIYPISSLERMGDKSIFSKMFSDEDKDLHSKFPTMRNHKLSQKFTKEGPLVYEAVYNDGYKNTGYIAFEVFDEAKLRERKEFMG